MDAGGQHGAHLFEHFRVFLGGPQTDVRGGPGVGHQNVPFYRSLVKFSLSMTPK